MELIASSANFGLDYCNRCNECCTQSPCLLLPDDVPRIAARLGETPHEFAERHLVAESVAGAWRVRMHKPCDFLRADGCSIHEFKPTPAADYKCWVPDDRMYFWTKQQLMEI